MGVAVGVESPNYIEVDSRAINCKLKEDKEKEDTVDSSRLSSCRCRCCEWLSAVMLRLLHSLSLSFELIHALRSATHTASRDRTSLKHDFHSSPHSRPQKICQLYYHLKQCRLRNIYEQTFEFSAL